jgi:hypothetical protein
MLPSLCRRTMLNNVDAAENFIKTDDSSAEVAIMVNHIYGGDQFVIDIDNVLDCSRIAQKYDMPRLQRAIGALVKHLELSDENLPQWMAVAHLSSELQELKERCISQAAKRLQHILNFR